MQRHDVLLMFFRRHVANERQNTINPRASQPSPCFFFMSVGIHFSAVGDPREWSRGGPGLASAALRLVSDTGDSTRPSGRFVAGSAASLSTLRARLSEPRPPTIPE
jgi:hypothetical protein